MLSGKKSITLVSNQEAKEINLKEEYNIESISSFIDDKLTQLVAEVMLSFQTETADYLEQPVKWPLEFGKCLRANFEDTLEFYNFYRESILLTHKTFVQLEKIKAYLNQSPKAENLTERQLKRLNNSHIFIQEIYFFSITRLYLYTIEILRQRPEFELDPLFFHEVQAFELTDADKLYTQEQLSNVRIAILLSIVQRFDFTAFTSGTLVKKLIAANNELSKAASIHMLTSFFETVEFLQNVQIRDIIIVSPKIADSRLAEFISEISPYTTSNKYNKNNSVTSNSERVESFLEYLPVGIPRLYLLNLFIISKFKFFTRSFNLISGPNSQVIKLLDNVFDDFVSHSEFFKFPKTFKDFSSTVPLAPFTIMSHLHLIKACCVIGLTLNNSHDTLKRIKSRHSYLSKAAQLAESLISIDQYLLQNEWAFNITSYATIRIDELIKSTKVTYIKQAYKRETGSASSITEDLLLLKSEIDQKLSELTEQIKKIQDQESEKQSKIAESVKIREENHEKFYQEVLKESKLQRAKMIQEWEKSEKIKAERERARNKALLAARKKKSQESEETSNNLTEEKIDPITQKFKEACVLLNSNKLEEAHAIYNNILSSPDCSLLNTVEALMYISDYHQKVAKKHVRQNQFKEAAQHFYGALFNATSAVRLIQKKPSSISLSISEAAKDRLTSNQQDLRAFEEYTREILLKAKIEREEFIKNHPDRWRKGNPQKPSQKSVAFSSLVTSSILIEKANQKYKEVEQMIPLQNQIKDHNQGNDQAQVAPANELITKFMVIVRDSNGRVIKDKYRRSLDDMALLNPSYLKPFFKSELGEEAYGPRYKKFIINELARENFRELFAQNEFRYDRSEPILQPVIDR